MVILTATILVSSFSPLITNKVTCWQNLEPINPILSENFFKMSSLIVKKNFQANIAFYPKYQYDWWKWSGSDRIDSDLNKRTNKWG